MDKRIITLVQSFGFSVYMRGAENTYMMYTDGKRIGYLQEQRLGGYSVGTVHIPNLTSGTGFPMSSEPLDEPTKEALMLGFCHAPHWAFNSVRESVAKWRDIEHFRSANTFNNQHTLIPKEV